MYGRVHANRVFYRYKPAPGNSYRQIVIVELETFQVRVFEGEVKQAAPQFDVNNPYAEVTIHPDLKSGIEDAKKQFDSSEKDGWVPY